MGITAGSREVPEKKGPVTRDINIYNNNINNNNNNYNNKMTLERNYQHWWKYEEMTEK